MKSKNIIIAGLALVLMTFGCTKTKMGHVEGEVIKISGTLPALVDSSGAIFGNRSVQISDLSLVYTVKADDGIFTLNILENGAVPRATLMARVCVKTKISFPVQLFEGQDGDVKNDPNFHVGSVSAKDVRVLEPCI